MRVDPPTLIALGFLAFALLIGVVMIVEALAWLMGWEK